MTITRVVVAMVQIRLNPNILQQDAPSAAMQSDTIQLVLQSRVPVKLRSQIILPTIVERPSENSRPIYQRHADQADFPTAGQRCFAAATRAVGHEVPVSMTKRMTAHRGREAHCLSMSYRPLTQVQRETMHSWKTKWKCNVWMKESGDRVTDHIQPTSCVVYDKHLQQAVNSDGRRNYPSHVTE